jgi:hypothetical protein
MGAGVTFTLAPDPATLPGDLDGDGGVDLDDYAALSDCLEGPAEAPEPTCPLTPQDCRNALDFDGDSDVDLLDFAEFTTVLNGR